MTKFYSFLIQMIFVSAAFAQTNLPTSFDFATAPATLPVGWTTNTTANYSSGLNDLSGGTSRAGKLQSTAHYFAVEFYDEPGSVSYYLKSYGTASFMGTLVVEESENGSTWTNLETYGNNDFTDSWTQFSVTPDPDSRHIRIVLTNKVSGTNAGLDNMQITQNITPVQEMNVQFEDNNVPHTTSIQFAEALSSTLSVKLGIENLGTANSLIVGASSFSGPAASDYSVAYSPDSVSSQSNDTMIIHFTPSAMGNRTAQISIANNDLNENPYIINLNGVGGLSASEPTSSPSSHNIAYLKTWKINASVEDVGADGYLVLFRKGAAVTDVPVDGISYTRGEGIGSAKVAKSGSGTFFQIRSCEAETDYFIKVFAFNGSGSLTNYRTSDPYEVVIGTPVASMNNSNYWSGLDETNTNFVDDLYDAINPHNVRFYSNYDEDMVAGYLARDTTGGQEVMTCVYSSVNVSFAPPFDWTSTNMNREHTLPASWMPTAGNSGTPEYQDFHHLFQTEATANSQRSNRPLGNVVNVTSSFGDGKAGTDNSGNGVYEPRDQQKGDAARAIFYMMTAYGWNQANLQTQGSDQKMGVLLNWHLNDLPSKSERARNDYIDSLQHNRNPFVDSAHWACYIDFKTMSYIAEPDSQCLAMTGISIQEPVDTTDTSTYVERIRVESKWVISPNPAQNNVWISGGSNTDVMVEVSNLNGQIVLPLNQGRTLDLSTLPNGIYWISIREIEGRESEFHSIIIQR